MNFFSNLIYYLPLTVANEKEVRNDTLFKSKFLKGITTRKYITLIEKGEILKQFYDFYQYCIPLKKQYSAFYKNQKDRDFLEVFVEISNEEFEEFIENKAFFTNLVEFIASTEKVLTYFYQTPLLEKQILFRKYVEGVEYKKFEIHFIKENWVALATHENLVEKIDQSITGVKKWLLELTDNELLNENFLFVADFQYNKKMILDGDPRMIPIFRKNLDEINKKYSISDALYPDSNLYFGYLYKMIWALKDQKNFMDYVEEIFKNENRKVKNVRIVYLSNFL